MIILMSLLAALLLITWFTENGDFGWSLFTLVGLAAIVYFVNKELITTNLWTFIADNTGYFIAGAVIYLVLGIGWSLLKWKWFAEDHYKEYSSQLMVYGNKAQITCWMMWWPMSLGWFLLHDPVTRLYNYIYSKLSKTFQSIADSAKVKYKKEKT